jgi:membrane-associated phospholipid phosphatase
MTLMFRLPSYERLGALLLAGLALAICSLLFFAWLAEEMLEGETGAFDEGVRSFAQSHASPALTSVMRGVTLLGSTKFLVALGICILIAFVLAGWRRGAMLFAVTMGGATVLNLALKSSFRRVRPAPFFDTPLPSSYSFPSGHALLSFCFYGALAAILAARLPCRSARAAVWVSATLLVALIGISRVYLGVHYPSDVLAGYAAAMVWVMTVAFGDYVARSRTDADNSAGDGLVRD